jgi:hypothetical protein
MSNARYLARSAIQARSSTAAANASSGPTTQAMTKSQARRSDRPPPRSQARQIA